MSEDAASRGCFCSRCGRACGQRVYEVRVGAATQTQCLRCALRHPPLLWRSVRVALLVGSILVLLNQGDRLLAPEGLGPELWWKVPLTYVVPFVVVTYGALANARREPP